MNNVTQALLGVLTAVALIVGINALASCTDPNAKPPTPTETYEVKQLFEINGCKVYRFRDGLYDHHFASCPGTTDDGHLESSGKTSHWRPDEVPTVLRPG